MSRSLKLSLALLVTLSGCAAQPPAPAVQQPDPDPLIAEYSNLQHWLGMQKTVAEMPPETVTTQLTKTAESTNANDLFYYGLLHQQLLSYDSWTEARDTFRLLLDYDGLTIEQKQLAGTFEDYNQNRINWYQRYIKLEQQYSESQLKLLDMEHEKRLLEQKIQALTDLEEAISTRKEQ